MCNQSTWTTIVQAGAATLSPIIAVVGGWIAWQQVRINRNKLKLDRFEKRFAIHEAAMTFVASITTRAAISTEELNDFLAKTRGARFLLSKEIADYLNDIYRKAGELQSTITMMQGPPLSEEWREKFANKWTGLNEWFQQQLNVIPEKFAPFLSVDDI